MGAAGRRGLTLFGAGLLAGLGLGAIALFGLPESSAEAPAPASAPAAASETEAAQPHLTAPLEGSPAPEFELPDLEGGVQRLSDLQGSVVVVNFWATWCGPCEAEMPLLDETYRSLRQQGLVVLAVNYDESEAAVREFRDGLDLAFPVLLDPGGEVQQLYRVLGFPTTFFIDREGVVRVKHIGILSDSNLEGYLAELGLTAQ